MAVTEPTSYYQRPITSRYKQHVSTPSPTLYQHKNPLHTGDTHVRVTHRYVTQLTAREGLLLDKPVVLFHKVRSVMGKNRAAVFRVAFALSI